MVLTIGLSAAIAVPMFASPSEGAKEPKEVKEFPMVSMKTIFAELPVGVLDLLNRSTRLDMLDYAAVDSVYPAMNLLEGTSKLLKITDDYALVELTDVSNLQLKLLPDKKHGYVIMALYTVGSPAQVEDTGINFYSPDYLELKTSDYFPMLKTKDFFAISKGSKLTQKDLDAMLPFPSYKLTASPEDQTVTCELTIGSDIDLDDLKTLREYLHNPVVLSWSGKKFK